jgi:hypothetical protein
VCVWARTVKNRRGVLWRHVQCTSINGECFFIIVELYVFSFLCTWGREWTGLHLTSGITNFWVIVLFRRPVRYIYSCAEESPLTCSLKIPLLKTNECFVLSSVIVVAFIIQTPKITFIVKFLAVYNTCLIYKISQFRESLFHCQIRENLLLWQG